MNYDYVEGLDEDSELGEPSDPGEVEPLALKRIKSGVVKAAVVDESEAGNKPALKPGEKIKNNEEKNVGCSEALKQILSTETLFQLLLFLSPKDAISVSRVNVEAYTTMSTSSKFWKAKLLEHIRKQNVGMIPAAIRRALQVRNDWKKAFVLHLWFNCHLNTLIECKYYKSRSNRLNQAPNLRTHVERLLRRERPKNYRLPPQCCSETVDGGCKSSLDSLLYDEQGVSFYTYDPSEDSELLVLGSHSGGVVLICKQSMQREALPTDKPVPRFRILVCIQELLVQEILVDWDQRLIIITTQNGAMKLYSIKTLIEENKPHPTNYHALEAARQKHLQEYPDHNLYENPIRSPWDATQLFSNLSYKQVVNLGKKFWEELRYKNLQTHSALSIHEPNMRCWLFKIDNSFQFPDKLLQAAQDHKEGELPHVWTYDCNGKLSRRKLMDGGFKRAKNELEERILREYFGFRLLVCLADGSVSVLDCHSKERLLHIPPIKIKDERKNIEKKEECSVQEIYEKYLFVVF